MSFIKENKGGPIILPLACCSISGCSGCPARPGASSNLYHQQANSTAKNAGAGGGAS